MKRNLVYIILGILAGLNLFAWIAVWELGGNEGLEVTFFDVGQGDAIFIEIPQGHQILVDGGPTSIILEKLGQEMPFWDRTIDLIILTHPDFDHISGLIEVLKRYQVENILWTGVLCETAECQEWQKLIKEEGANIFIARSGLRIFGKSDFPLNFKGSRTSINFDILYPFESLEGKTVSNTNNTSVVARLVYGENSFLFTGDAYQSVERQLLSQAEQPIDSDVLKVGHHGSKNSSAEDFIEAVSPEIGVISVGQDNKYGHPHAETLAILEKYDIRTLERTLNASHLNVLRTDINGDIKILCNSQSLKPK